VKPELSRLALVPAHFRSISPPEVVAMKYFKLILPLGSLAGTLALAGHIIGLS